VLNVTIAVPRLNMPSRDAAPRARSITRRYFCGCRSVIVTTTLAPVSCTVTRTRLPSGRDEWAAVMAFMSNTAPLLVRRP
jgi:hypothetical protein